MTTRAETERLRKEADRAALNWLNSACAQLESEVNPRNVNQVYLAAKHWLWLHKRRRKLKSGQTPSETR